MTTLHCEWSPYYPPNGSQKFHRLSRYTSLVLSGAKCSCRSASREAIRNRSRYCFHPYCLIGYSRPRLWGNVPPSASCQFEGRIYQVQRGGWNSYSLGQLPSWKRCPDIWGGSPPQCNWNFELQGSSLLGRVDLHG